MVGFCVSREDTAVKGEGDLDLGFVGYAREGVGSAREGRGRG